MEKDNRSNVDEKNAKGLNDSADTWWDPQGKKYSFAINFKLIQKFYDKYFMNFRPT